METWRGVRGIAAACWLACSDYRMKNCAWPSLLGDQPGLDNQTTLRLKKRPAEEIREQLTLGTPTNEDEAGVRRLVRQLEAKKVVVKLILRHPLHAKLYLLFRSARLSAIWEAAT